MQITATAEQGRRQHIGLWAGPLACLTILLLPTPAEMPAAAQNVAATATLMAIWWICEPIPIPATSLLPIVLFPLLGIMPTSQATAPFANHLIFLFMGGFIIALSIQRWDLHKRIALHIIRSVGFSPKRLVLGFMLATAFLSAFVSNTATAVMMLPIALAVTQQAKAEASRVHNANTINALEPLGLNLMLGIAYAASIGGVATLIGTPPNTVLAGYLANTYGYEITFAQWLRIGLPLALVFLPLSWWWLTMIANPMPTVHTHSGAAPIQQAIKALGPMRIGERWTAIVFALTAAGWIGRPYLIKLCNAPNMISDATVAMFGALLLFAIPIDRRRRRFAMDWNEASKLPWGVLLLFGGGLSLAHGFQTSGLAHWIVNQTEYLNTLPTIVLIVAIIATVIFLTELTSNTATAAMLMPVLSGIGIGLGQSPLILLAPAAIAASCAFMLPVATPPNAIIFASGHVTIPQMARSGFGLNLIGIVLVTLLTYLILIPAFAITLGETPTWAQQ